jgi:hypothetical protein
LAQTMQKRSLYDSLHDIYHRVLPIAKLWGFRIALFVPIAASAAGLFSGGVKEFLESHGKYSVALLIGLGWAGFEILRSAIIGHAQTETEDKLLSSASLFEHLTTYVKEHSIRAVKVDLFAYSAETFGPHLPGFIREVAHRRESQLLIRILIKDTNQFQVIPKAVDQVRTAQYRDQVINRFKGILDGLIGELESISAEAAIKGTISFEIRKYAIDPFQKGLILNDGRVAGWNLYPMKASVLPGWHDAWDCKGLGVDFLLFREDGGIADEAALKSLNGWFNAVWDHFSEPVTQLGTRPERPGFDAPEKRASR